MGIMFWAIYGMLKGMANIDLFEEIHKGAESVVNLVTGKKKEEIVEAEGEVV